MNYWKRRRLQRQLNNQIPLLGGWRRAQAARTLAQEALNGDRRVTEMLVQAFLHNSNAEVREIAWQTFHRLEAKACINAVCAIWFETRDKNLGKLIAAKNWAASGPPELRVYSALQAKRSDLLQRLNPGRISDLLAACADNAPEIAAAAAEAFRQLQNAETREAVFATFINENPPALQEIIRTLDYLPKDATRRALFFFLTEQWAQYETLDFDRRILRTAYEAAPPGLRQRIMARLRASGRTAYLTVVAGGTKRDRVDEITPGEADLLVQMHTANREWEALWPLAFGLPFDWSVQIIRTLAEAGWQPAHPEEQAVFAELQAIASAEMEATTRGILRAIPPATRQARIRVAGRVNDVAFAPHRPVIAVGTSGRKVVLWNFETATREALISGFDHSVGQVEFTQAGDLLLAERTNRRDEDCFVYRWQGGQLEQLGAHTGSVTALIPYQHEFAVSAGADQSIFVWDVPQKRLLAALDGHWTTARGLAASPDGVQIASLFKGAALWALPEFRFVGFATSWQDRGTARHGVFTPDGAHLLVGTYKGGVYPLTRDENMLAVGETITQHAGRIVGLRMLARPAALVSGGSEGDIRVTAWPGLAPLGELHAPGKNLTSLHISPDGAFMATGDSDASMSLWDLRPLLGRYLVTRPLAALTPADATTINLLAAAEHLPHPTRQALKYVARVLQHRFRYDIEVADAHTILAGEFDIEIGD